MRAGFRTCPAKPKEVQREKPTPNTRPRIALDEPRWHASLAVIAALLLYAFLPQHLVFGPVWFAPLLVLLVLIPLSIFAPAREDETPFHRTASILAIALLNAFNVLSVALLLIDAFGHGAGHAKISGERLLLSGAQIWMTNVLVFSLWFWEIDGGGPWQRSKARDANHDLSASFLFPQMMVDPKRILAVAADWKPLFLDYLYLAFTNALAFSPTDAMPVTRPAKALMMAEAVLSFVTIALVVSRAINII